MKNILIVDDNPQNLYLLQTLLGGHGYGVTVASNGAEALEKARGGRPDLIISDILMPVMDGFALCREWKRDDRLKDIPFVFFTSTYTDPKDEEFAMGLGAERFIAMPQEPEIFLSIIEGVFSGHKTVPMAAPCEVRPDEAVYFREYNEALIRKLEDKMVEVAEARRRLEHEVAERIRGAEALRVILDSSDNGILAVETSGKTIFFNKRFLDLWRIPQTIADSGNDNVLLGFVQNQLVDPDDFLRKVKQLYGTADDLNDTLHFKDGRVFERNSMPLNDDGSVIGRLWTFRDITERKRTEEVLRESEAKFRLLTNQFHAVLDAIPDNITRQSPDLRVIWANRGAAAGLKKEAADLVGNHCYALWHNRTSACEVCPVLKTFRTGEPALEIVTTPDGRTWELRSVPLKEAGRVVEVVEIGRNITENRKLEEQVRQSQKMESVGRLAGGVAHDFNNLLTVITGYSELLLQKIGEESPMRGEVEEIRQAGERAASLTQQLLAFSRKQIIEPRVVQLDSLVAEMHKMLTRLIGEDIALQAITGKSLGSVKADPGQFQQILMNLVVNARDAMPGGGKIVIETSNVGLDEGYCASHPYVKPGRFVMLSVSDTGKGMSDEVKAHVFEPFFTTKERGSGTGLGLATAFGAVKQAGGSIEVYSEVGIGTTIRIYLPRVDEEAVKPVKDARPTEPTGGTETVLIVEDEDIVRDLGVRILERLGYKVLQSRNGAEAIAEAQGYGDRIDLLLTDVVMPGMNGAELATQLVVHHREMKVLFTSGYTEDVISHHGVLAEGVSFIGKPYTPKALARKVREVLDKVG